MRAAVFKRPGVPLVIEDRPVPKPAEGQVLIKVARCGICGSDLHMTEHNPEGLGYPLDSVIGHEFSGEVVELGAGVSKFAVGDRVAAHIMTGCGACLACLNGLPKHCEGFGSVGAGFAEYSLIPVRESIRLPDSLSFEDGALVEPLAVGLHAINAVRMEPGARILVIGAGPVGLATIYWARLLQAGKIVATARTGQRAELAKSMGASAFLTPQEEMIEAVNAELGGWPDYVFECVGLPGLLMQAINHVKPLGTVAVLGFCQKADPVVPAVASFFKEVVLRFPFAYSLSEFEQTADALDAGHVEPRAMITGHIGLDDLPGELEALRRRTHQCKVMVQP